MDILVVDRDALAGQLISSKLEALGHKTVVEPNKNAAFDMIRDRGFDCIMIDPAPMAEARPVIIGIWKNVRSAIKPYILLLSKSATMEDALQAGTNDVLNKPFSSQEIETKTANAARLLEISRHLAREDNVHSSGGMIGKAAFNQLFLSAVDRACRYGERSLIVFAELANYDEILAAVGPVETEAVLKKLTEKLTFMRRQSDVIGRLSEHDFAIILQRPQYESEPIDAINRFSEVLDKFYQGFDNKAAAPKMRLSLIEVPQGAQQAERFVPLAAHAAVDE